MGAHLTESLATVECAAEALAAGQSRREAARAAQLTEAEASRRRVRRWYKQVTGCLQRLASALGIGVGRGREIWQTLRRAFGLPADAAQLFERLRIALLARLDGVLWGPLRLYRGVGARAAP
jgi:hypothetical protein